MKKKSILYRLAVYNNPIASVGDYHNTIEEAKEYYKEFTHSPDIHFTIIKQTNEIVFEFKK